MAPADEVRDATGPASEQSAAEPLGPCSAKTRGPKSRFKEYPESAGGNKDGKTSIPGFPNLISEKVGT
jgi:hypothetical protein